jgi:predicted nucleic acid-binding protein
MGSIADIPGPSVYLDANIFIYAVEELPLVAKRIAALFQRIDRGELIAITSELSLSEALVKPMRDNLTKVVYQYLDLIRTKSTLSVIPVDREILIKAAELRSQSTLKLPNAIHCATAVRHSCKSFVTNDRRLKATGALQVAVLMDLDEPT